VSDEVAKRGRKPLILDKAEFQRTVTDLETEKGFSNRSTLWKAVEETAWAKSLLPRALTAQVAMMKAEEMQILINTPKGKRGRSKGEGPVVGGGRKKKTFSLPMLESGVPVEERAGLEKTLQKAANGSLKARIKLNCLNCTNWQKKEVSLCETRSCPLWDVRPYKNVKVVKETIEIDGEEFIETKIVEKVTGEFVGCQNVSDGNGGLV